MKTKKSTLPVIGALRHHFLPASETFIYNSIRGVTRYRTKVFAISRKSEQKFQLPNVTALRSLPLGNAEGLLYRTTTYSPRFFKWAKEVDILHAHMGYTGVHGILASYRLGIPLVTSFYGNDIAILRSKQKNLPEYWHFRLLVKALFKRGERFLVLSSDMQSKLEELGCPSKKITINPLGIDLDLFSTPRLPKESASPIQVLMVGREVQKKGFDDGLRACSAAIAQGASLQVTLHGNNGPLHDELQRLAAQLKLKLTCIDPASPVSASMKNADLLLVPSRTADNGDREGTPTVICEGSAAGLPIVATRHAGIPEQVTHGVTGLLCEEQDIPDLTQNLLRFSKQPNLCFTMGQEAVKKANADFGISSHCDRLQATYDEIMRTQT